MSNSILGDLWYLDTEGSDGPNWIRSQSATINTSQTQNEISFSELMDTYAKLKAMAPPRKTYFIDAETANSIPDLLDSPNVFVMPLAYQTMMPKQWKRRMFNPPYRKVILEPRCVATPKGILSVDEQRRIFK